MTQEELKNVKVGQMVKANQDAFCAGCELKIGQMYEVRRIYEFGDELRILVDGDGTNYVYWAADHFNKGE